MLAGDFERKLRKLNRSLRIYCSDYDSRPAGIFHVVNGEYTNICGIDKHYVPERSIRMPWGAHYKGGWRRALNILIKKKLINKKEAEKLFKTRLGVNKPDFHVQETKFRSQYGTTITKGDL